ncbi:Mediator of RNA polymerase II transcription subunit 24 [Camelus dromedarius]|uniref:Mediator of RNA polymerase II transcription subunit 24 n=1 Tax=Camelus dromedarius TaxID=9838 RepID=A0A5N4D082_CAMDR|nr:Mediator of RNA polymerase II transcription subunit 24 [Camelus dromedarius]
MPEEGKILKLTTLASGPTPQWSPGGSAQQLSSDVNLVQMKWHKAVSAFSWASWKSSRLGNGVLAFESIQKITDNIKGKVAVWQCVAMAWLVSMCGCWGDEHEKSLQMIRHWQGPLYSKNTLQFLQ